LVESSGTSREEATVGQHDELGLVSRRAGRINSAAASLRADVRKEVR
jgi:hypothetical protein